MERHQHPHHTLTRHSTDTSNCGHHSRHHPQLPPLCSQAHTQAHTQVTHRSHTATLSVNVQLSICCPLGQSAWRVQRRHLLRNHSLCLSALPVQTPQACCVSGSLSYRHHSNEICSEQKLCVLHQHRNCLRSSTLTHLVSVSQCHNNSGHLARLLSTAQGPGTIMPSSAVSAHMQAAVNGCCCFTSQLASSQNQLAPTACTSDQHSSGTQRSCSQRQQRTLQQQHQQQQHMCMSI